MNNKSGKTKYADIIDLPHHQSATRKHMSLYDRAAQFSPFAALSGYDDMVKEEARHTDREIELSENEIEIINSVIADINTIIENGNHPTVTITYFKPDLNKSGGRYETLTAIIKRVDTIDKRLVFYGSDDIEDKRIPTIDVHIERIFQLSLSCTPQQSC